MAFNALMGAWGWRRTSLRSARKRRFIRSAVPSCRTAKAQKGRLDRAMAHVNARMAQFICGVLKIP